MDEKEVVCLPSVEVTSIRNPLFDVEPSLLKTIVALPVMDILFDGFLQSAVFNFLCTPMPS